MPSKHLTAVLLVPIAMLGCGGSGLHKPDSGTTGPSDTAPQIEASTADIPTSPCEIASTPMCLANCIEDYPPLQQASCRDGQWVCPSGFMDSKTCPADACAVTSGQCCDVVTGDLTRNPCPSGGGLRPLCPAGTERSHERLCIPQALGIWDCSELDGQPCSGEAHSCRSMSRMGDALCSCYTLTDLDAGMAVWRCAYAIP